MMSISGDRTDGVNLLITTQAVDLDDPVLGFFHGWIEVLAAKFGKIHVICLKEGRHDLPENVCIHSLGKEHRESKISYVLNFYRYLWRFRREYDAVYVHMNQEYVLLGGLLWKFLKKRVYLWRNHHTGSFATDIAASLSTKVFCTSRLSYTAKFKKTILMPVGVDTDAFRPDISTRTPRSILFLARIAPSKRPDMLLDALAKLAAKDVAFRASFYGSPLQEHQLYADRLKEQTRRLGLSDRVFWRGGVPHAAAPRVFASHDIFVNLSRSGMYDKTIFEAAACGTLVLAASRDFASVADPRFIFSENSVEDLAKKIESLLSLPLPERERAARELQALAQKNSLHELAERLAAKMSSVAPT